MTAAERAVAFLQDLLRIPSPPGGESEVAGRVRREMDSVGYDEVSTDAAGSVSGVVHGRGEAPAVLFLTHLDHVDAGDPEDWPHPPFAGRLRDGRVWGRGAVDIKGPLAAQVHGVAAALRDGGRPPGDVTVAVSVQEEVGGLGARHLAERAVPPLAVVGEPSSNELRRGHRGRAELLVRIRGRSAHAAHPDRGANPLYVAGDLLGRIEDDELPSHPELGPATVTPTLVSTDQDSSNVIPGELRLTLDCRLVPDLDAAAVGERIAPHLQAAERPGTSASVEIPVFERETYKGLTMAMPAEIPPYLLPPDDPALRTAGDVLSEALGARPAVGVWNFATDGGHLAAAGATVVGFGPGDEERAHTVRESIDVEALDAAVRAYGALARSWPAAWGAAVG